MLEDISEHIKLVVNFPRIKEINYLKVDKHIKDNCELLNKDKYIKFRNHLHDDYFSSVD